MKNASLTSSSFKMLVAGLALSCPYAYAGTEGYLSTSTAAGSSEVGPTAVFSGQAGVNARESARRHAEVQAAMQLLQEGRTAYEAGKYSVALEKFRQAWDRVPHAPATRKLQEFLRKSIADASIAVAIENSKVGRYDEAEQLLLEVQQLDPNNARARKELSLLRDPIRNNPALTPEHVKNVDEVNRLLHLAWGYYDLGQLDAANAEFANVLKIDPYNTAARRGQESVNKRRSAYYRASYDSYRAKALAEVDSMWDEAAPTIIDFGGRDTTTGSSGDNITEKQIKIRESLDSVRVARVNFENTPISDVVDFILGEIRRSGVGHINVNFVKPVQKPVAAAPAPVASDDDEDDEDSEETSAPAPVAQVTEYVEPTVQVNLEGVTLRQLLEEVCSQTGCVPVVRDTGIFIYTKGDPNAVDLDDRTWNSVPWDYLAGGSDSDEDGGGDEEDDPFGSSASKSSKGKYDPQPVLTRTAGVTWPKGSYATYNRRTQRLVVHNTPENLEKIDALIDDARSNETPMVKVTTKFVEVTQVNEEELSFDWVVNPFSMNNAGTTYLGGGTGTAANPTRTFQDFITSGGTGYTNNHKNSGSWPISNNSSLASATDAITQGLVTSGLRSGGAAMASSTMDSLIASGTPTSTANTAPAPGILSLSGIYDQGSFQMIMRGLSQKRGADVMSAPSMVLTPGEEGEVPPGPVDDRLGSSAIEADGAARIEVVRRFVYPTSYEKPEVQGSNNNNNNNNRGTSMPVATPANPEDFAVEEVGMVMVVKADKPTANNTIVKFNTFIVRVVDFEGFINYGSPIVSGVANENQIETVVLTENRIDQPIFSRRMVNTTLSLYDGHTVAIGGMIEDKVQKVEDKVPVFGDLPLIGRFFRSNAESHTRKNLTIFVTADIIDATGKPVRSRGGDVQQGADTSAAPGLFPEDGLMP